MSNTPVPKTPQRFKIIFLDVDGVLNCQKTRERFNGMFGIDREKAALFREIMCKTNARIVLSSTWRKHPEFEAHLWRVLGPTIAAMCLGQTPAFNEVMRNGGMIPTVRGDEIAAWLATSPNVERFVIIDDGNDMAHLLPHLIQTSWEEGLTREITDQVIARLNAPLPILEAAMK